MGRAAEVGMGGGAERENGEHDEEKSEPAVNLDERKRNEKRKVNHKKRKTKKKEKKKRKVKVTKNKQTKIGTYTHTRARTLRAIASAFSCVVGCRNRWREGAQLLY